MSGVLKIVQRLSELVVDKTAANIPPTPSAERDLWHSVQTHKEEMRLVQKSDIPPAQSLIYILRPCFGLSVCYISIFTPEEV